MVDIDSSYEKSLERGPESFWNTVRNSEFATTVADALIYTASYLSAAKYTTERGCVLFDTSSIPAGAVITTLELHLYPTQKSDADTDTIRVVRHSTWSRPSNPPDSSDYLTTYWGSVVGSKTVASFTTNQYNTITLDTSTGINKGGSTRYYILSNRDYSDNPPTGINYLYCPSTNKAYLTVEYTTSGKKKIVLVV